jgi:uncharacterized phage-like protein YoqJ
MKDKGVVNLYDSEKNNDLCICVKLSKCCFFAEKIHRFRLDYKNKFSFGKENGYILTEGDGYLLTIKYEYDGELREFYCESESYKDLSQLSNHIIAIRL